VEWRRLKLSYPSPFRNLAVEEALAHAVSIGVQKQPTLRIWSNPRTVVVGRFQEVAEEVDVQQCELNEVHIARRFTGGGTVFQDEATLNLTLVTRPEEGLSNLAFHELNLQLIREALDSLGIRSSTSRNSALIDGRKVCGAAAAVGLHFALWHCSILVETDTQLLRRVLAPSKSTTKSRFVRSKWQEVTTLTEALSRPISIKEVARALERTVENRLGMRLVTGQLAPEEEGLSETLYSDKYCSGKWNRHGNHGYRRTVGGPIRQSRYVCAQRP